MGVSSELLLKGENMKCPSCGEALSEEAVLVPIWDYEGELIDCFHVNNKIYEAFIKRCEELGLDINDVFEDFLRMGS